jgi:DNA-binding CsgD family transcriptional regulator
MQVVIRYHRILLIRSIALLLFTCFSAKTLCNSSQIKNFKKNDYQAASQNWAVSLTSLNNIYFGNNLGLLYFDGVTWKLYPSPNGTIVRAVILDASNRVYTGGYRELGYWQKNSKGILEYQSLAPLFKEYFSTNEEFWNIITLNEIVYFHSFTGVFVYESDSARVIQPGGFVNYLGSVGNRVLFAIRDEGMFWITQDGYESFVESDWLNGKSVRAVLELDDRKSYLVATESNGVFIYNNETGTVDEWSVALNNLLARDKINRVVELPGGKIGVGTILNGVYIVDKGGTIHQHFNVDNGMQSNTVLDISKDSIGNLWLALDKGIDYLSLANPTSYVFTRDIGIGALYTGALFENNFYVGTNQGLYSKSLSGNQDNFELVPGTQEQVWDIKQIDDALFIGHNSGTFLIKNNTVRKISGYSGGYSIVRHPKNNDILIQSTYSNLVIYKKEASKWRVSHSIANFNNLIRHLEFDHLNNLWASHLYQGVYKINLNDRLDSVISIKYFDGEALANASAQKLYVFNVENRIVFTTGTKLYTYNDLNDSIVSYDLLNEQLGKYAGAHKIIPAVDNRYWFISLDGIACYSIKHNTVSLINEYPIDLFENELIPMYENVVPFSADKALVCLESGYVMLNTSLENGNNLIQNYKPGLKQLSISSINNKTKTLSISENNFIIPYKWNSLLVRFSFPIFSVEPIQYQYKISGLMAQWSELTEKPIFSINRIPPGEYTLSIKAINNWGYSSQESTLSFKVLPPFYRSKVAFVVYLILLILSAVLFRYLIVRKVKIKEKRKRKEKEDELIKLRNEKLKAELSFKSQQLANSTMGIIKKNEFLLSLKGMLKRQKDDLGTRYPDKYFQAVTRKIDNNISGDDDWRIFEANFELAHERFLLSLKGSYPDLTPSDLKLCAFLRINLTSKEIAPLLGITVRGVENHRYRLRKKLNLPPDDNLTDFILSL